MGRIARAVMAGHPHHITQRGNYRQTIFDDPQDYVWYSQWLRDYSARHSLKIWSYCLMSNHVHFIAVPMWPDSLAKVFNTLHMRYSQYYNKKKGVQGHLWQGRFFSCILDEAHLYAAMRYVENNPVRAGIVPEAASYRWSSAISHVNGVRDQLLSDDCYLLKNIKDWKAYLREGEDAKIVKNLRDNTKTGRPCGDESFVRRIETALKRKLSTSPPGRPKNEN